MKIKELVDALNLFSEKEILSLYTLVMNSSQIIMIGNGGSNSICSHISQDYTKQLKKKSYAFSDPSRLTCYINDYGRDNAYAQFLKEFSDTDTFVILISSSGNSMNVINCAKYCLDTGISYMILTGFDETNKLRSEYSRDAKLDIYVDSRDYGVVETAHQAFLHTIVGKF